MYECSAETGQISIETEHGSWCAEVEAQSCDYLRLRLVTGLNRPLPELLSGEEVDCMAVDAEGRCYARARVVEQRGELIWLKIAPIWTRNEKRRSPRIHADFDVTCSVHDRELSGRCVDISAGGMRVLLEKCLPVMTRMRVRFQIAPKEPEMIFQAMVIHHEPARDSSNRYEVGLKFLGLTPSQGAYLSNLLYLS
jgi:c-di-GMP-binding flagellar brake protein YcgR